jgi:hypothetical protein
VCLNYITSLNRRCDLVALQWLRSILLIRLNCICESVGVVAGLFDMPIPICPGVSLEAFGAPGEGWMIGLDPVQSECDSPSRLLELLVLLPFGRHGLCTSIR